MDLGELIDGLGIRPVGGSPGDVLDARRRRVRICDLTEDSRTVVPGSLFIARGGRKADGKAYIDQALASGAVAILSDEDDGALGRLGVPALHAPDALLASALLAERFYGNPSRQLRLVMVTGTNGKTTISTLIWQLLNAARVRCGLVGTVCIDDGTEVAPAMMTTPPSVEVSRTLQRMVEAGCVAASLEASSHALDQKRLDALSIGVGVYTNLTGDHLDYHTTMDRYAAAKSRLFELVRPDGRAIVNMDDPWCARVTGASRAPVWRCTAAGAEGADCAVSMSGVTIGGMELALRGPWGLIEARVPMVGAFNAMNVLQATAAGHEMGLTCEELARGLPGLRAPDGRLEPVPDQRAGIQVFVDYAHSDDSLRNTLAAVAPLVHGGEGAKRRGRLWVVFGCGGDKDRTKRPRMGRAAAELADMVVVTSDNPRTERPGDIIDEILAGVPAALREKVTVQADRAKAIGHAIAQAAPGDVVILAGKGHETEQVLPDGKGGTVRVHFDDREVARAALEARARSAAPRGTPSRGRRVEVAAPGRWGRGPGGA